MGLQLLEDLDFKNPVRGDKRFTPASLAAIANSSVYFVGFSGIEPQDQPDGNGGFVKYDIVGGNKNDGWVFEKSTKAVDDANGKIDTVDAKVEDINQSVKTDKGKGIYVMNTEGKVFMLLEVRGVHSSNQTPQFPGKIVIGNKDGKVSVQLDENGISASNMLNIFPDEILIGNREGKVVFRANGTKVEYAGQSTGGPGGGLTLPYAGLKLGTPGDSLSTSGKWQQVLADYLGFDFDNTLNITGSGGYPAPSIGGTRVVPSGPIEIYWRAQEIHNYGFNHIIFYGGQNDTLQTMGTIDDTPFISLAKHETSTAVLADAIAEINSVDRVLNHYVYYGVSSSARYTGATIDDVDFLNTSNWTATRPTFAASYMGILEIMIRRNPSAKFYLVTLMRYWITKVFRSDGFLDIDATIAAASREPARIQIKDLIIAIGKKYGIPVINLWDESGVTYDNADQFYPSEGNVHPNDYGYENMGIKMLRYF